MGPQTPYGALAMLFLSKITRHYNLTENFIFHKYKKEFCQQISDLIIFYHCNNFSLGDITFKVTRAFGFKGHRDFFSKEIHHILPCLIPWFIKVPQSQPLLTEIARLVQKGPSTLLSELFFKIYPIIYLNESSTMTSNIMKFITKITHCSERDLKRKDFRMMISELIVHYHSNKEAVIAACENLASIDPDYSKDDDCFVVDGPLSQVIDFLHPRFLGVLGIFGSQLVNSQVADSVKRKVLESLTDLIELMGDKYITPLRFKVMATLRSALSLNVKEYGPLHINAWNAFIRTVNIQSLGSLLSTIFVSLTPLLDHYYTEVNNLFSFLVINHESLLSSFMPDLFFISELNIDENIKMIVHSHIQQVKSDSMIENLKLLLKQVKHEDIEVRQYALQYVTKLLSDNKQELNDAILSSDMMNPVIVELIDALVTGTRESETLKLDYARCLGELGAIEPSHLPRRFEDTSVFTFSATDDTFAISALMELSRALQFEKHTKFMDNFAVAIQEILKFYKISPTEKKAIWESLPESMQEVMLILLSSRYVVQPSMSPDRIHPIFGSSGASTFSKWAFIWVSALIPQIANKDISVLFSSCKPSLNRDLRTLILFLPYIILHVLFGNNDEVNTQIFEEMQTIINIKPHSYKTIQNNKQDKKYLPTIALDPIKKAKPIEEDTHIKCCKTIYVLIDFLERWVREWVHVNCPRVKNPLDNLHYKAIYNFVNKFDKSVLSKGNFECEEYSRALLYLEWYLEENEEKISSYLSDLANIYAKLDEGDAVAGILSIMEHEPSLQDQILFHEVTGQLQDAAACYEIKAQEISLDRDLMLGMIRCYLGLDQPYMAYKLAHSVSMIEDEIGCSITESLAEPLWRLGKWDDLSELLVREEVKESPEWGVRFGHALLSFKNRQRNDFKMELDTMRTNLMCNLTNVTMENGAYQQAYPHIIKLHILNEFESVDSLVHMVTNCKSNVEILKAVHNLLSNWAVRLNILESTGTTVEPVLCARRIFLEQAKVIMSDRECIVNNVLDEFIAKSWINSVRLARKAGLYQQAYTYILNAEMYKPKELFVEKAKLLWQKGEQSSAIRALVRGVDEQFPDLNKFKTASSGEIIADRKLCAEAKLLIAIYNDDSVNVGTEENLTNYKTAVDVFKHWEKSLVYLAQYYDKVYSTLGGDETENRFTESPRLIIHFYGNSLYFGCHYIYQSMPRMLSVWLDYVASDKDPSKTTLTKITAMIANFAEKLPTFKFFTAFSQLVSRICHPQPVVYTQLKEILIKIIQRYPQQSLWMILCVYKSSYVQRYKRCAEVLQDPRLNGTDTAKLINDFNILAEKMIDLTNKTIPNGLQETTVAAINRHIQKTFLDPQFSQIMMPVQEFRKMVMPSQEYYDSKRNRNDFNAFPNKMVYITGIQDRVIILASLQKPRRISLKGSDGKNYSLLLKPKDDLRKDFRLMEFNTIVNQYLHKNPVARERRLKIRTYSVLPLNEECGIIEWISNVIPLRPALIKIYKEKQIYTNAEKLKAMWVPKESLDIKRKVFLSFYIKNHPPVFSEWFRLNFPDPHGWYQAKCAYIRTTSVISMVGYILGLGDRHGENILFDSTNGDTMHVDFNCLFNKGLAFEYPERVPFRMTHNMVKAMGPTGVEGMFRKSCEITMNILRAQRETLMSVLRPFVYDPLLSWSSRSNNTSKSVSTERMDKESMRSVENIEKRLKGIVRVRSDQLESTYPVKVR
ncbi:serine/threonine-protein kinase ATR-like [Ctenocephalides felis]|uniref:serine/threonine-protein kinase ATR-like n=1 Tax=Ctenocephalides felis TaxID=7515 RepID=UPI000E6E40DC|nr:serine/threonine-protein kinase ATR-like [Ctenocephalides felis]